ncbi:MAG: hypothetical protein ACK5KP_11165 [Paludibacteraceae bacterium]
MTNELSNLKVYYGWARLNKVRRQPAISVMFENTIEARSERGMNTVKRMQHTIYERFQTVHEADDGAKENRILTEFSIFLFDKKVKGNLEFLLEQNSIADENNVPEDIRKEIKNALRSEFKQVYKDLKL